MPTPESRDGARFFFPGLGLIGLFRMSRVCFQFGTIAAGRGRECVHGCCFRLSDDEKAALIERNRRKVLFLRMANEIMRNLERETLTGEVFMLRVALQERILSKTFKTTLNVALFMIKRYISQEMTFV